MTAASKVEQAKRALVALLTFERCPQRLRKQAAGDQCQLFQKLLLNVRFDVEKMIACTGVLAALCQRERLQAARFPVGRIGVSLGTSFPKFRCAAMKVRAKINLPSMRLSPPRLLARIFPDRGVG